MKITPHAPHAHQVGTCAHCKRAFTDGENVFEFVFGREGEGGPTFTFCGPCKDYMLEVDDAAGNAIAEARA